MQSFPHNDTDAILLAIKDIPADQLGQDFLERVVQGGRCRVWVTERPHPGIPFISQGKITFPYHVDRPDHRYNCTDHILDSGHTSASEQRDIASKVTAEFRVIEGHLYIFNIYDHGWNEETMGGTAIVTKLKSFSGGDAPKG